jgi:hypothetical protein
MSNNYFQRTIKKLLKIENDILELERTVARDDSRERERPDRSFRRRYFNEMIEVDIGSEGGGQVRLTDSGSELLTEFSTINEAASSLHGILIAYEPQSEINLAGRGPLTSWYEVHAFKMLVKAYADIIRHLSSGGRSDESVVVQEEENTGSEEERQDGRTARVMEAINNNEESE